MLLEGKKGLVLGVANKRSIAWAIAQALAREGAELAFTYQGDRLKESVEELAGTLTKKSKPFLKRWGKASARFISSFIALPSPPKKNSRAAPLTPHGTVFPLRKM